MSADVERKILAAQGYVELGIFDEARLLIESLPANQQQRSDVIEIRLLCLMQLSAWEHALSEAIHLMELEPREPGGYIHAAYCLHELHRTHEAMDLLARGPKSLRSKSVYYYNMGCYLATLGENDQAIRLLHRAFQMDDNLKSVARKDPDVMHLL